MNVDYSSKKLEKQCTESKALQKEFGKLSKGVERRVAEMYAADTLGELRSGPGLWHDLHGDRDGTVAGRVSGNWRIVVRPESLEDDCTNVVVEMVEDYH